MTETLPPNLPECPKCASAYTYEDGPLLICPECAHECSAADADDDAAKTIRDCVGNELKDGDTVSIAKDLKVGNSAIKVGTKVKNIRIVPEGEQVSGHDIDGKVPGFGPMGLKSSVVKKVTEG